MYVACSSYYHAVVVDFRERLVEVAVQILIITLDNEGEASQPGTIEPGTTQPEVRGDMQSHL